jgi:hypothetical protein
MIYEIHVQEPVPRSIGFRQLALTREGRALAIGRDGKLAAAELSRAKVELIGVDGILISGFEEIGQDETGKPKFRYQEWWCQAKTAGRKNINQERNA